MDLPITKKSRVTIQELTGLALTHSPMTFAISDLAPGRKVFFPIPLKKRPKGMTDFLYVYVESKLPTDPQDKAVGFTQADVVDETGVYIFQNNADCPDGVTIPLDILLVDVIQDHSLRARLIQRVGEMRSMIHLDEEFLDGATLQWINKVLPIPKRFH